VTQNKIDKPAGVAEQQVVSTPALLLGAHEKDRDEGHCPAETLNIGIAVSLTVIKQTLFLIYIDMQLLQYRLSA